jgi:hypothetical protein
MLFLPFLFLAPLLFLIPLLLSWIAGNRPLLVVIGLAGLLPGLSALLVSMAGPARLLVGFKAFGLLLGGRARRRIRHALLFALVAAALPAGGTHEGPPLPGGPGQPAREGREARADSAGYLLVADLLLLGTAGIVLAGLLGLGFARRRQTYGNARFLPIDQEFGDRRRAAAALLVRRRETRRARRQFVRSPRRSSTRFVFLTWDQLSRHLMVVGASGSGKTTGFFNHLMLSARIPWIYQDQKAELPLRGRFPDRPVWGLDTRGHETRSAVWNPLDEIRGPEDVEVLAALLFPDRPGDQNLWVVQGARRIFGSLLKRERHSSLQSLAWSLENEPADALTTRLRAGSAATLADPRTRGHYLSELLEVLSPWTSSRIARITQAPSTVSLGNFMDRGGYVLCNEAEHELRGPVTAFWGLLFHRLRNRPAGASRLMLLLDEFGDAGRIPHMAQALALYRAKNVALVAGIQSYALMESVYRREWKAVRDGFGTVFVLTANLEHGLAERLSRELGQFTRRAASWSLSAHLSAQGPTVGPSLGPGPEAGVRLVSPDEWGEWKHARACLARAAWPTWWVPCPLEIEPTPPGAMEAMPTTDWRVTDAMRLASLKAGPSPPVAGNVSGGVAVGEGTGPTREPWRVF